MSRLRALIGILACVFGCSSSSAPATITEADASSCTAPTLATGAWVTQSWVVGPMPVAKGGTIGDGSYVLSDWTGYASSSGTTSTFTARDAERLVVAGNQVTWSWQYDDGAIVQGAAEGTMSTSGAELDVQLCGRPPATYSFDATPTTLVLYYRQARFTYLRE